MSHYRQNVCCKSSTSIQLLVPSLPKEEKKTVHSSALEVITDKLQVSLMYFMHRIVKNAKYIKLIILLRNIKCDFYLMLINE
jgi:hypothetical protein